MSLRVKKQKRNGISSEEESKETKEEENNSWKLSIVYSPKQRPETGTNIKEGFRTPNLG